MVEVKDLTGFVKAYFTYFTPENVRFAHGDCTEFTTGKPLYDPSWIIGKAVPRKDQARDILQGLVWLSEPYASRLERTYVCDETRGLANKIVESRPHLVRRIERKLVEIEKDQPPLEREPAPLPE